MTEDNFSDRDIANDDLYNRPPFYKNSDDLLDWFADELPDVYVGLVARHVLTKPGSPREWDNMMQSIRAIKFDDLPRVLEAFFKLNAEAAKMIVDDHSEQITLKYPAKVEVTITAEQVKFFVDLACEATGKDMFELWNGRES